MIQIKILGRLALIRNDIVLRKQIGENQLRSTEQNFKNQADPDGKAWPPLKRATQKAKKRNKDKILTESRRLRKGINYRIAGDNIYVGIRLSYARIHNEGGTIKRFARSRSVEFNVNRRTGTSRFAKRGKGNFAQNVTFSGGTITIPQRQYLGVGKRDKEEIRQIILDRAKKLARGKS